MTRRIARVAAIAAVAAAPLAIASPASAECVLASQPPRVSAIVCVGYDPNIDWYCRIGAGQLVFVCPT